jgi:hypothetical protein
VTGIGERLEDDWDAAVTKVRELTGHPEPVPPIQAIPTSQENHVPIGTEFHRIATILETFGEDAIAIFEAIAGNPETRAAAITLANLAGLPLTGSTITAGVAGLGMIQNVWHAAQQAVIADQQAHGTQQGTPVATPAMVK